MSQYNAPLRDMQFVLNELLQVEDELKAMPPHAEVNRELIGQVLEEAGRFASEVLLPLNATGDKEGCHLDPSTHAVTAPKGFKEAYRQFADAGWPGLACDPQYGGQGLPLVVNSVMYEMMNACNQAWTMYPGLTHGAYECVREHGSPEQKELYLTRFASGEWSGTMCLTESHCGTDLGLLRTRAEPQADGTYRLTGSKIFISAGEHDLADNIVHLVLARLPDAPPGTKGISLFIVPKVIPNDDGSLGARNDIFCTGLEHKMGIHGNATCQINLDGATGWMLGEPNRGLNAMFVMMNAARLGVSMQSLGVTEIAYQNALTYAKDRIQSRSLTGPKAPDKPADPIIVHPDVRRMLLTAKAYAEGGRALTYFIALQIDKEVTHPDEDVRREAADVVALLTPIAKAFVTDNAWIATSEAMQVYGGHGYIAEWGMEQYVRDCRINMIYEGTNTIQALDLLGRKVLMDNGAKLRKFGEQISAFVEENGTDEAMSEFITPLADLGEKVGKLTMEIGMKAFQSRDEVGAAAVPYLRVVGHLLYAYFFARMAKLALAKQETGDAFYQSKLATARFYFARLLPETAMLIRQARSGAAPLMALDADLF
jgi:alkylation response protein AidB-like acyl-CoA dehydrogenase